MRRLPVISCVLALATLGVVGPSPSAGAVPSAGTVNLAFDVSTVLPQFPCPTSCTASLGGALLAGGGNVTGGAPATNATFAMLGGSVTGSAGYIEFEFPICPAGGSADGTVSFTGDDVTGPAYQPTGAGSFSVGNLDAASGSNIRFEYIRAGVGATVVLTPLAGGTMDFHASFPDHSEATWTSPVVGGGGAAAFTVDPGDAQRVALACVPDAPPTFNVPVHVRGSVTLVLGGT